jgi:hypothetical protein
MRITLVEEKYSGIGYHSWEIT